MSASLNGLIFLDLDGTIEDSRLDMANAAVRVRKNLGLQQRSPESMFPYVIKGMDFLYRQCFGEALADPSILGSQFADEKSALGELARMYTDVYSGCIVENTRCYPGMADTLKQLASSYHLGLYTNKPEGLSRLLLDKLGLAEYFHLVFGGDTLPESKPSALPLLTGIQQISQSTGNDLSEVKARSVMVGDSAGDTVAARKAEILSIWAAYGYYQDKPEGADAEASVPSDLPERIAEILD